MKPSIQALQATRDRVLRDVIDRDPGVQQALEHLRHLRSGRGFEYRRNLLSRALRVTRSMSPELAEGVTQAREQLGLEAPVELYVVSQPEFNATCAREHNGLVIVTLTSRLVEEFSSAEIRFVIGHELGHALFGHFDIPMPATAVLHQYGVPFVSKAMALKLYAWCRVTEVTADRVGAVCAGDPKAAISGLFKLASGTSSPRLKPDLEAFANQVHSLSSTPEARDASHDQRTLDCFSTHPYNPIRVRAAWAFSRSVLFHQLTGGRSDEAQPLSMDTVEAMIQEDLQLMEPNYLQEAGPEADLMRKLLYTAGFAVAQASGGVDAAELRALAALLGSDVAQMPSDLSRVIDDLDRRILDACYLPLRLRAQLLQHLTIVSAADGQVQPEELDVMLHVANGLQLPSRIVFETLRWAQVPMD